MKYRVLILGLLAVAGCAKGEVTGSESHFIKCGVDEDCPEGTCDEDRGVCVGTDAGAMPEDLTDPPPPPPPPPPSPPDMAAESRADAGTSAPLPDPPPSSTAMEPASNLGQPCTVEFSVKTEGYGGMFGQNNTGAIWITDKDGAPVRLLEGWIGNSGRRVLKRWKSTRVGMDAISSASIRPHQTHDVSWDCTDQAGQLVPLGTYVVHVEVASSNTDIPYFTIPFEHTGTLALEETVAPIRGFAGATLKYQPENGASGAPPPPVCKELLMTGKESPWCELSTSCPGAMEQTSCEQHVQGQTYCTCSSTSGLREVRLPDVTTPDACAAAREQCQDLEPVVTQRECSFTPLFYLTASGAPACSLTKDCLFIAIDQGITLGPRRTVAAVDCEQVGSGWRCNCSNYKQVDRFSFDLEDGADACGRALSACEEL